MNGRAARLIRKFAVWAKVTDHGEIRRRKRAWKAMSHRERGVTRRRIERVMSLPAGAIDRAVMFKAR